MQFIFVYGTLRKEERASGTLDDCEFIGPAHVGNRVGQAVDPATGEMVAIAPFLLTLPGHSHFPAVVTVPQASAQENGLRIPQQRIRGEVYRLPAGNRQEISQRLDQYEGYPRLYGRTEVMAFLESGHNVRCHMYYMLLGLDHLRDFRVITSGDWKAREDTVPYREYTAPGYDHGNNQPRRDAGLDDVFNRIRAYRAGPHHVHVIDDEIDEDEIPDEEFG